MTKTARTAAGDGLPDASKIDWTAIWMRVGEAAALLELPDTEIAAVLAEQDAEAAVLGFCNRHDVSLDWLVLGEGAPVANRRPQSGGREE